MTCTWPVTTAPSPPGAAASKGPDENPASPAAAIAFTRMLLTPTGTVNDCSALVEAKDSVTVGGGAANAEEAAIALASRTTVPSAALRARRRPGAPVLRN